jgi:hypothetical protein
MINIEKRAKEIKYVIDSFSLLCFDHRKNFSKPAILKNNPKICDINSIK